MSTKHIEVSKKIKLAKPVNPADLRKSLVDYLQKAIDVETMSDGETNFRITGTTGSPSSITRHARVDLTVDINYTGKEDTARIIISGSAKAARSLVILYCFAFFLLLVVGLLPGFYETSQEESGAIDALFFLIFGIFIVFDVNNKLSVTRELLETSLDSLDTTFG